MNCLTDFMIILEVSVVKIAPVCKRVSIVYKHVDSVDTYVGSYSVTGMSDGRREPVGWPQEGTPVKWLSHRKILHEAFYISYHNFC